MWLVFFLTHHNTCPVTFHHERALIACLFAAAWYPQWFSACCSCFPRFLRDGSKQAVAVRASRPNDRGITKKNTPSLAIRIMFVSGSSTEKTVNALAPLVHSAIRRELPSLKAIAGAQHHGGVVIGDATREPFVHPVVYLRDRATGAMSSEPATIDAVTAAATPAPFGSGEDTVLDARVRSTLRVEHGQCAVEWAGLTAALVEFGQTVLLLSRAQAQDHVVAELHNVLVYREGDFFAPHRDSHKCPGHVGTLSVLVPSLSSSSSSEQQQTPFVGGELQFAIGGTAVKSWVASADRAPWAAWIGNVRHAVTRVVSGTRVVAVYNVALRIGGSVSRPPPVAAATAINATTTGMTTAAAAASTGDASATDAADHMPGTLRQLRPHMFARCVETPFLGARDLLALRATCRAWNAHIGGIVGAFASMFRRASSVATSAIESIGCQDVFRAGAAGGRVPLVVPLRNIYSTGGGDAERVPPSHLWGADLLLYEAAALAVGASRVAIGPVSVIIERQTERPESHLRDDNLHGLAREVLVEDADDSRRRESDERLTFRAPHLGHIGWRRIGGEMDAELRLRPVLFDPRCMILGGRRIRLPVWRQRIRRWSMAYRATATGDTPTSSSSSSCADASDERVPCEDHAPFQKLCQEFHERGVMKGSRYDSCDESSAGSVDETEYTGGSGAAAAAASDDDDDDDDDAAHGDGNASRNNGNRVEILRQLRNVRRDPLRRLVPDGYTCNLWGNQASFRIMWHRHAALVVALGDGDSGGDGDGDGGSASSTGMDATDWDALLGPPPESTVPVEAEAHVARGETAAAFCY